MIIRRLKYAATDLWENAWAFLRNVYRRARWRRLDFAYLHLSGSLPDYVPPRPRWQRWLPFDLPTAHTGPTFNWLRYAMKRLADDPRLRGVIIKLDGLDIGWAQAQSVRNLINRARAKGKFVIVYANSYDIISYFIAITADISMVLSAGRWDITGLRVELIFLKDTLATLGIEAEVINVSPYKTAYDTWARAEISPEHRDMLNWVLDGQYDYLVDAIATSQHLPPERVRELIDGAPYDADTAVRHDLLFASLHEDHLQSLATLALRALQLRADRAQNADAPQTAPKNVMGKDKPHSLPIMQWRQIADKLVEPIHWHSGKQIAVIRIEGTIVPGRSRKAPAPLPLPVPIPLINNDFVGADTVVQHLREAELDDEIAAIVLSIDSPGGAAIASSLIWREVDRVRRKKPVVAYLSNYATSGGYYVAAGANWIVAQPLTITGSIGVISMKVVTAGLFERFRANRVVLARGAHAGIYSDLMPFSPEQRAIVQADVDRCYNEFKQVVISGRQLDDEAFEALAGGRIWLGKQALEHKLIDALGDLETAINKAKELANLPDTRHTPTVWYYGVSGNLLPPPSPDPLPFEFPDAIALLNVLSEQRVWMLAPFDIRVKH